jgi:hypothetical protein
MTRKMVVAEGAGDGGSSSEVLVDEGADYLGLEAVLLVDEVVGDVELLGYAACVVDIVDEQQRPWTDSGMPGGGVSRAAQAAVPTPGRWDFS